MPPLCSALLCCMCHAFYTRCFGHSLLYLCASSLQHLAVPQDIYSFSISPWKDLGDILFGGVGLAGFESRANASLLAQVASSFFVFYCFTFLSLRWVRRNVC